MIDQNVLGDSEDLKKAQPSDLDKETLLLRLKNWFSADMAHSAEWRQNGKRWFGMVAGDQWAAEDRAALEETNRPVITFNRVLSIVKAVAGIEINGRHDVVYLPRQVDGPIIKANELLSNASNWMSDGCDAEDEQSEAFHDTIICGMGWTEQRIGYDEDPDGKYIEQKVDPLEMFWDRSARSKNLQDARRVFRVRKMSLDEARDLARSISGEAVPDEDLDAYWAASGDVDKPKPVERRRKKKDANSTNDNDEVHIVHAQWIEKEPYWRVADSITKKVLSLDNDRYEAYVKLAKSEGIDYKAVKQTRKVYKQCFIGGVILGEVTECPGKDRFSFQCITGERDRNTGTWFGLAKPMEDPQLWANKWLSQTLHILNTTAKGGILAEEDAFENQREAEETYALPDAITWVRKEAIQKGKIMQKPGVGIPTAYVNLLEFAISSIRDATGINLELLGMRDANQPGILEAQRKQSSMTIMATLFDSLRRFRKNVGRIRLHYIQNYLADGRMIRIAGEEGMKLVPLIRDQVSGDYEIIVEEAPTSPDQKQQIWEIIKETMPAFREFMTPEAAMTVMEYSPLPPKIVEAFKKLIQAPDPGKEERQKFMIAKAKGDLSAQDAKTQKDIADAEATRVSSILDLANAGAVIAGNTMQYVVDNIVSPEPWKVPQMQGEFAVAPMENSQATLPSLPQLPVQGA